MASSVIKGNSPRFGTEIVVPYETDYTAPADGYLRITTNPNSNGVTVVNINGVLLLQGHNPNTYYKVDSIFVRSGSIIYYTNTGGASYVDGRFEPYA